MSQIKIASKFLDPSTISGSGDRMRQEMGRFWQSGSAGYGFQRSELYSNGEGHLPLSESLIAGIISEPSAWKTNTTTQILPSWTLPLRITGSSTHIRSSAEWFIYLLGGSIGDNNIDGILQQQRVFDVMGFDYLFQYEKMYSKQLRAEAGTDLGWSSVDLGYVYNDYLPAYESYTSDLQEAQIPSMYMIYAGTDTTTNFVNSFEESVLTRNDQISASAITNLLSEVNTLVLPPRPSAEVENSGIYYYVDVNPNLRTYLNDDVPKTPLDEGTLEALQSGMSNVFFDHAATNVFFDTTQGFQAAVSKFPYYASLNFSDGNTEDSTAPPDKYFKTIIEDNQFDRKFLKLLKERFLMEETTPQPATFVQSSQLDSGSDGSIHTQHTTNLQTVLGVNYITMLANSYNNFSPTTAGGSYVYADSADASWQALYADFDAFRFFNTAVTIDTLNKTVSEISDNSARYYQYDLDDNNSSGLEEQDAFGKFLDDADTSCYKETMAFRIEKRKTTSAGGTASDTTIQNFWIYNNSNIAEYPFVDNQVKYGETYTYNIYAYVLVPGTKYRYSDLIIAETIRQQVNSHGVTEYCVSFKNAEDELVEPLVGSTAALGDQFIIISEVPYIADVNFTYEPHLMLYQVPIASKTMTILDNPANSLDVVSFQTLDDSQRLGFFINYESFDAIPMPIPILEEQKTYTEDYRRSNDLLPTDIVDKESVSPQGSIEVYKSATKPKSYDDFSDKFIELISLKQTQKYYLSNSIFYDKVSTNQTYYYLFRFLNAHGEPGHISPIIEATLVDDGGYKYSIFNELLERDLEVDPLTRPSVSFKKLLHVVPNLQHLTLDSSDVDFGDTAYSQLDHLSVGDPSLTDDLWGKTFKLRLTSKKTGKKIDLNLTYNLNNE